MADSKTTQRIDFSHGVSIDRLADGSMTTGHVGDDEVVLIRRGEEFFAIAAHCTHYKGPLAEGLLVGTTVRCPWHHACFDLRSGEAVRAPALDPIPCWRVERLGDAIIVREKLEPKTAPLRRGMRGGSAKPESVVIIGGGAAGFAAADMLRREGYDRPITMISADDDAPCDRPNLSKDYLAGTASEDWMPLRPEDFYRDQRIDLLLRAGVSSIDVNKRRVMLESGELHPFGALLIATGAEPVKLNVPVSGTTIRYLRTFADSRAIISHAESAKRVLVIGASFIGLEVAASLRARNLEVHVVAPEKQPLERVMGPEIGRFIKTVHEEHGVVFHLGTTVKSVDGRTVLLVDGTKLEVDMVVAGVGVRPLISLAAEAGLTIDRGIAVDEFLETSAPNIFAAGDVARWPDPHSGERIRVEHWVVAERQGQVAARNILGQRECFESVPFFWSQHYDLSINYVGHAEKWDKIDVDGRLEDRDARVTFMKDGHELAVATVFRDHESLEAELLMEQGAEPPHDAPGVPTSLRYD